MFLVLLLSYLKSITHIETEHIGLYISELKHWKQCLPFPLLPINNNYNKHTFLNLPLQLRMFNKTEQHA
jgi:hypothetical protein